MSSSLMLDIGPIPPPPELVGFIALILLVTAGVAIIWKNKKRGI